VSEAVERLEPLERLDGCFSDDATKTAVFRPRTRHFSPALILSPLSFETRPSPSTITASNSITGLPSFGWLIGLGYIAQSDAEQGRCLQEVLMTKKPLVVHSDPEILGGTPVFVGTRVPLRNLFDYLKRGHGIDEFLDAFPSVSREQAIAVLENAHEVLTADARAAR